MDAASKQAHAVVAARSQPREKARHWDRSDMVDHIARGYAAFDLPGAGSRVIRGG
jgi:hypothetical protein